MGLNTTRCKIRAAILWGAAGALCSFLPFSVQAEDATAPFAFQARYNLAWNGLPVGRLIVIAKEDATSYSMTVDSKTRGLAALINNDNTVTTTTGKRGEKGEYFPEHYAFRPQGKNAENYLTLDYDGAGHLTKRDRPNDDNPAWRPAVPVEEANTAHDPLTVIFMLRRALRDAVLAKRSEVSARTYDGMRLFELKLADAAHAQVKVIDEKKDAIGVTIHRTPINGYTPKELKKYQKGDPEITFYFSNDAAFIPVRAVADSGFGDITLTLEKLE